MRTSCCCYQANISTIATTKWQHNFPLSWVMMYWSMIANCMFRYITRCCFNVLIEFVNINNYLLYSYNDNSNKNGSKSGSSEIQLQLQDKMAILYPTDATCISLSNPIWRTVHWKWKYFKNQERYEKCKKLACINNIKH